jgi:release factor glutamine methyltransferase
MTSTLGALYQEGAASLADAGVPSPEHDARALLAHVLEVRLNDVLLRAAEPAQDLDELVYDHLLALRRGRMPLQYVTRHTFFRDLELHTDERALIPRHETEQLVEAVIERLQALDLSPGALVADVGCGSGAIGLALAHELPALGVVMTDVSAVAVELAGENTRSLGLQDRVMLLVGPYLQPLREAGLMDRVVALVCNPPYVRPAEMTMVDPEIHAEPRVAVESPAADGLEAYRVFAVEARELTSLRLMAFEVGFAQEEVVKDLMAPLGRVEILRDFQGIERVVIVHVG